MERSGDRRRQAVVVAVYTAALGLLCLWVGTQTQSVATNMGGFEFPPFLNPVLFWALTAAPSVYLLLFANRKVRAVGPVVLAFAGFSWRQVFGECGLASRHQAGSGRDLLLERCDAWPEVHPHPFAVVCRTNKMVHTRTVSPRPKPYNPQWRAQSVEIR